MDSQVIDNTIPSTNTHSPQRCTSSCDISHIDCKSINTTNSNDHVFDVNDHTTLISNGALKIKKHNCRCSLSGANESKSSALSFQPWITFIHIMCTVRKRFYHLITKQNIYYNIFIYNVYSNNYVNVFTVE